MRQSRISDQPLLADRRELDATVVGPATLISAISLLVRLDESPSAAG